MAWQAVDCPTAGTGSLQHACLGEPLQHSGQLDGVGGRDRGQASVADRILGSSKGQRQPFVVTELLEFVTEHDVQGFHHVLWEQVEHAQFQDGLVEGRVTVEQCRGLPVLRLPALKDFRDTGACLLAQADKPEHLVQRAVATVGLATLNGRLHRNAHGAGVAKAEGAGALDDLHRGAIGVIGMDQRVEQRFTHGGVNRGFVLPDAIFQTEGYLQVCGKLQVDLAEEVVQVAGPGAIQRQTVRPAQCVGRFWLFLVVEHVVGQSLLNGRHGAEHQQASNGQALFTLLAILPPAADHLHG